MTRWWQQPEIVARFVSDLMAGELGRLRPGRAPRPLPWSADLRLEADLGVDSLERIHLATALAEAIHLSRSGIDDALLAQPTVGAWVETVVRSLERFSAELTFKTSGSTGEPKWHVHSLAALIEEAGIHARDFPRTRRVIAAVPGHHIYGFLFTVLLPVALGVEVVDVRAHAPAQLGERVRDGDVVVGHPQFWTALVRSVPRVAAGAVGVTSTGPCPPETARGVVARGFERLVEIYGSSETAGIGRRADPGASFEVLPFWRRGAGEHDLVRLTPGGADRIVVVPDRLIWEDDRHLRPAGRIEGAVVVGGTNVFPARVAAALETLPGVAAAAVRLMSPHEGDRLKAFIVPACSDADRQMLQAELWAWIDTHLSVPERPKSIVFGPALPAGPLGKSADWPISD